MRRGGIGRRFCHWRHLALAHDLHENLVLLDHAQLIAGTLLDRAGAVLQVAHFGFEFGVTGFQFHILLIRLRDLRFHVGNAQPAAFARPEGKLYQQQQGRQGKRNQAQGFRLKNRPENSGRSVGDYYFNYYNYCNYFRL